MNNAQEFLKNLDIVMVGTRFPENIGMTARACANMGAGNIILVTPERWDRKKASPLATAKGQHILDTLTLAPSIQEALAPYTLAIGTTARTGGQRRELLSPEAMARETVQLLRQGERVALVMGAEDRGLTNEELLHCQRLTTIPTSPVASSLNVAQATLLLLYECFKAAQQAASRFADRQAAAQGMLELRPSRRIHIDEQDRLYRVIKETLLDIDFLHSDNPDYFLLPLRRFLGRSDIRRHEYDALMGVCRQIRFVASFHKMYTSPKEEN